MTATHGDSSSLRNARERSDPPLLRDALHAADAERRRLNSERDAFQTFAEDVAALDRPASTATTSLFDANIGRDVLQTVRTLYRESAMATPHYADEYGERLCENMAAELQRDVAAAVVDGDQWSPHLQQLLIYRARVAARQREELLEVIGLERESLEEGRHRLRDVSVAVEEHQKPRLDGRSFSVFVDLEATLRRRIDECERLLAERQRQIHHLNDRYWDYEICLHKYLYESLETGFPVLRTALDRMEQLRERREAVVAEIIYY